MAGKKPVWVDEEAHSVLKRYSKLVKASMVEVASSLVVEHLDTLSPEAGLEAAPAQSAAPQHLDTARPTVTTPSTVKKQSARKPKARRPDPNDASTRFVGGIWLV